MNYIVNEHQLRRFILEEKNENISNDLKTMKSFVVDVIAGVKKKYGINLKFLITWGTAIGGLVMPLDAYIRNGNFELSEEQIYLVIVGVVLIQLFNSSKAIGEVLDKIKEEGLTDIFNTSSEKFKELKSSYLDFMNSLNLTIGSTGELIAYAFLIPIVTDIVEIASGTSNLWANSQLIAERLLMSGVIVVSSQILTEIIAKILKRIS
jgi:hypothetical protein